jgi:hypothetical protein
MSSIAIDEFNEFRGEVISINRGLRGHPPPHP